VATRFVSALLYNISGISQADLGRYLVQTREVIDIPV